MTYIAPVYAFLALGILFLNHISLVQCVKSKEKEFFLMCGGLLVGAANMVLVKSGIGAIFTLADFFLILYLANKVRFDRIQLGVFSLSCLVIWFYWQFIDQSSYYTGDVVFNSNGLSLVIFSCFCVFICYVVYLLSLYSQMPKWGYWLLVLPFLYFLTKRVQSFNARELSLLFLHGLLPFIFCRKRNLRYRLF